MCLDPYRREGGTVSERVEKLVEKVDRELFGVLSKRQLDTVRAALLEARRDGIWAADAAISEMSAELEGITDGALVVTKIREKLHGLAGEERTK
jgi:hypothetical protein